MWNHVGVKSTTYNKPSLSLASLPLTNHQFFSAMRNAVLRSECWKMCLVSRLFLLLSWRWFKRILESTYAAVKAPHTSSLTFCDFRGHVKILNWYVSYVLPPASQVPRAHRHHQSVPHLQLFKHSTLESKKCRSSCRALDFEKKPFHWSYHVTA